jgi:hypothetical protein
LATEKKSPIAQERDEGVRGLWRWLAKHFDARRLVFIDESGLHTSMMRLRARAPRGERAYGQGPDKPQEHHADRLHHPQRGNGRGDDYLEGATDALAFVEAYVEHFLAPTLAEGQVEWYSMGSERTGGRRRSENSWRPGAPSCCSWRPIRRT